MDLTEFCSMLSKLCKELRNWFTVDRVYGEYTISNGSITIPGMQDDQYFNIVGSVFNDGVHKYPTTDLKDETFDGAIWFMAVPNEIEELVNSICAYESEMGGVSPFTSESWGGYSYQRAVDSNGVVVGWKTAFSDELNKWRKI